MECRFYCLTLHKNSVSEKHISYLNIFVVIFNNWNVLADELDKAIKSFEELNGSHSSGTISRRQINDFKFLFAMFASFPGLLQGIV